MRPRRIDQHISRKVHKLRRTCAGGATVRLMGALVRSAEACAETMTAARAAASERAGRSEEGGLGGRHGCEWLACSIDCRVERNGHRRNFPVGLVTRNKK